MEPEQIFNELQEIKRFAILSSKRALTLSDVCALTGLSKSHIYKMTSNNSIPFYRNDGGKLLFFDKTEIENWCLKYRNKTADELESEAANYIVTGKKKGVPE